MKPIRFYSEYSIHLWTASYAVNSFPSQGQSPGQLGMAHLPVSGLVYVWFIKWHVLQRRPRVLHCCQGGPYGKHKERGLPCFEQLHLLVTLKQRGKHCVCSAGRVIALQVVCSLLKDFNNHLLQMWGMCGLWAFFFSQVLSKWYIFTSSLNFKNSFGMNHSNIAALECQAQAVGWPG